VPSVDGSCEFGGSGGNGNSSEPTRPSAIFSSRFPRVQYVDVKASLNF